MDAVGIDIGSTNVKAVLVSAGGELVASAQRALAWQRHGDVAELDADALWQAVLGALAALAGQAGPGTLARVGAIGSCGQYSSIVPVDADARPLAPMRLYLDQRGTSHCFDVLGRHEAAFTTWMERHPVPPVGGGLALGHLLAFQHDEPEVHERTVAYLEPADYVTARLTGAITATQGSMFASQLIDNRVLGSTCYDPELVAMAGVDAQRLPPLVPAGSVVGAVVPAVATATGLPVDVVVCTGITDSNAQAIATGADVAGRVGICIGTTGVVLSGVDTLGMDLDHEVLAMPGVRTDRYLVSAENGIAGRAVEHVVAELFHADDVLGSHGSHDPFAGFDDALEASPPGARGVRFLPWISGSMSPQTDATMRGGFVGVSLESRRVDLVRAMAEGVAHNLRWLLGPVETFTGERAEQVVLTGGAARSPAWSQIVADVVQRPVHVVADPCHSGAAASARWALDQVAGEPTPSRAVGSGDGGVAFGRAHQPDVATASVHAASQDQFVAAFEALRPLRLGASG